MAHKKIILFLLLSLTLFFTGMRGKTLSIAFKPGLFYPNNFLNPLVDSSNQQLQTMVDAFQAVRFLDANSQQMEKIGKLKTLGGELELYIGKNISVALGVESGSASSSSLFITHSTISGYSYTYSREFHLHVSHSAILGTVRYYFPLIRDIDVFAGAGAGYHTETIKSYSQYEEILEAGEEVYWKARGHSIAPHLNLGITYQFLKRIGISIGLSYIFGNINQFEVKQSKDVDLVGNPLTLVGENGVPEEFSQKLQGFHITVMLRLVF